MDRYDDLTKVIITVGAWLPGQSTVVDAVSVEEFELARKAGVVVEMAGMQLDAEGRPVHTALSERIIGIEPERLARVPEIVAIAYGKEKVAGVRAAVRGGLITTLITHAPLARALLDAD